MTRTGPRRVTVLRGSELETPAGRPAVVVRGTGGGTPPAPVPAPTDASTLQSPYGVPASAVQHCCGRGCRHCRIYWHRGET